MKTKKGRDKMRRTIVGGLVLVCFIASMTLIAVSSPATTSIDWASISQGASITDGEDDAVDDSRAATGYTGYTGCIAEPFGTITIDLGQVREDLIQINTHLWDHDDRYYYGYKIELSQDGTSWVPVVDKLDTKVSSQQYDTFSPIDARYIRYTGQRNSKNVGFHIIEVEAYSALQTTPEETSTPVPTVRTPHISLKMSLESSLKQGEIRSGVLTVMNEGNTAAKSVEVRISSESLDIDVSKEYDSIPPNEGRDVLFKVQPEEAGTFKIQVYAEYWDDKGDKYIETSDESIHVEAFETEESSETVGFEALFAIGGLLAVGALFKKKKKR